MVLVIVGWFVGVVGCIVMELVCDVSVGVVGWGVVDKFFFGCD